MCVWGGGPLNSFFCLLSEHTSAAFGVGSQTFLTTTCPPSFRFPEKSIDSEKSGLFPDFHVCDFVLLPAEESLSGLRVGFLLQSVQGSQLQVNVVRTSPVQTTTLEASFLQVILVDPS